MTYSNVARTGPTACTFFLKVPSVPDTLKGSEEEKGLECSECSPPPHLPSLNQVNKESISAFVPDPRPQLEKNTSEIEALWLWKPLAALLDLSHVSTLGECH